MEHALLLREQGDGREDTKGVTSEEDDIVGVSAHRRQLGVGDVLERVSSTRVLRQRSVEEIHNARLLAHADILEDRPEANGAVDSRLLLLLEVDALGIAAPLNVGDALVVPDVLIIANQSAMRVSREGGLTSAGEAEEERGGAVRSLVSARVKGEHALSMAYQEMSSPQERRGKNTCLGAK